MTDATPFLPGLSPVAGKPLTASRDAGNLTSNGGLVVLREIADRLGIADAIAGPVPDDRDPALVVHSYRDMATARMMAIAAGHEDVDDLDALRHKIWTNWIALFCAGYDKPPREIVLEVDDTADLVHGEQELALFNSHNGGYSL